MATTTPRPNTADHATTWEISGGSPLRGTISAAGAKNAVTKLLVATLLTDETCTLSNVPMIGEVDVTLRMLAGLGAHFERQGDTVTIQSRELSPQVPTSYSGVNRIPILFLGPLLNRLGEAEVPLVGGCKIGSRPIDFHMSGLIAMGAEVTTEGDRMLARSKRLRGCHHRLPYPSVGATENLLLAAVRARGTTVIEGAAMEPEVIDLILFLQQMGAQVAIDADRKIVIEGVDQLHGGTHRVIPDRIEAASYAAAAIATGGEVTIIGARQIDMLAYLNVLTRVGGRFSPTGEGLRFFRSGPLTPWHIETDVHPGFMTDWQQPTVVLLTQADGASVIHETVYENRFGYTRALVSMGANIQLSSQCLGRRTCRFVDGDFPHSAVVQGPTPLTPCDLTIPDLRAGFAYVLAALIAEGRSRLHNIQYLERGYESIPDKLRALGVDVNVRDA